MADFHKICRISRIMAADKRSVLSFSIFQGMLLWLPIFVGFIGFDPQNWIRVAFGRWRRIRQEVQVMRYIQTKQLLTDSIDAGDQLTIINRRLRGIPVKF